MRSFATLSLVASLATLAAASVHGREPHAHRRRAPGWIRKRQLARRIGDAVTLTVASDSDSAAFNSSVSLGFLGTTVANATVANATVANATAAAVDPTWYNGTALWFFEDGSDSACYTVHTDEDLVVGLPTEWWNHTGVVSDLCGQYLFIKDPATGAHVTALISDASGNNYTTLTRAAFKKLAPLSTGMLDISYYFLNATLAPASNSSSSSSSNSTAFNATAGVVVQAASAVPTAASLLPSAPVGSVSATKKKAAATSTTATTTTTDDSAAKASSSKAAAAASSSSEAVAAAASSSSKAAAEAASSSKAAAAAASSQAAAASSSRAAAAAAASASQEAAAAASASREAAAAASSSRAAAAAASSSRAAAAAASSAQAAAAASSKAAADAAWSSSSRAAAAASSKAAAAAAAQATSPSSSGSGGTVHSGGYATFYYQGGVAGNCGTVATDSEKVIALPTAMYANGKYCGAQIKATRVSTGESVIGTVRDSCPTCINNDCLDMSVAMFTAIATEEEGQVAITWEFV